MHQKILILGSSTKASVYVTKQLKKYGLHVTVVDWSDTPVKFSKYIDQFILLSSPIYNVESFMNDFTDLLKKNKFDCLLPIHDPAIEICKKYRGQIGSYCKVIGINDDPVQAYASDKSVLYNLASEIGISIPKGRLINTIQDLDMYLGQLAYPVVIKPIQSAVLKDNRIYQFKVKITNNENEVIDFVRENINNVPLLLQEYIEGYGIGYNIFAVNGKICNAYIHRRINEHGGISSYRESLPTNTYDLQLPAAELIKKIGWNGVAMIEFKIHNNIPFLMEMNGRFWGSIEVAIKSGLNYPVMLYESEFLHKVVACDMPIRMVKVRNLKDEIVLYADKLINKGKGREFAKWTWSVIKCIFRKDNFIEDNFFDNPAFVSATYFYELKRIIKKLSSRLKKRFIKIPYRKPNFKTGTQYSIAFACSGNICRSPFAQKYAEKINTTYKFSSYGTSLYNNRLSPLNAIKAALAFNIDLSTFQSKSVDISKLNKFDFIFIFDKKNYFDLKKLGADENKIFFLSDKEIDDPYGKDEKAFGNQYALIRSRIDQLFSAN
jgi:protein-tyrosine-phosphatase/predicted ATP-grasp superfamily ATP-dependent carboligase